jgi:hypothetical protein
MSKSAPYGKNRPSSFAETPERRYTDPRLAPPRSKLKGVEPITTNARFNAELSRLRDLEKGQRRLEREISRLRAERHLERRPNDKRALAALKALESRAAEDGEASTATPAGASESPAPSAVTEAFDIINDSTPAASPPPVDRNERADRLEKRLPKLLKGIRAQSELVEQLRYELSVELASRLKAHQRAAALAIFRAAQALAAAVDSEEALRATVLENGFLWLPELLPSPKLHSALVLGSETDPGSEISRVRRLLEDLKVLQ